MNQAKDSAVRKFTSLADDELLQNLCRRQSEFNMSNPYNTGGKWPRFRKYIMDVIKSRVCCQGFINLF